MLMTMIVMATNMKINHDDDSDDDDDDDKHENKT